MQSSYNFIKGAYVTNGENKIISTDYVRKNILIPEDEENNDEEAMIEEEKKAPQIDPEELLKKYEELGKRIILDAENEKKAILLRTQMEAANAEKKAYEKGYGEGKQNGYEDGHKEAYDQTIESAKAEASEIVAQADKLLRGAKDDYNNYLQDKKSEIINLALNIAESITRKTLSKDNSMNELIEEAFKISKGEDSIIIKANSVHSKELKDNSERWKLSYGIKNEIFIVCDDSMEPGNAVLEKPSGIVKVGIDIGMEQIRKAILG